MSTLLRRLLTLTLTALLIGNAICAGVCGMLCSAKVCCSMGPVRTTVAVESCCKHCVAPAAAGPEIGAVHRATCCDWIASKPDPAAAGSHQLAVLDLPMALPPPASIIEPLAQPDRENPAFWHEDRAPPGGRRTLHGARAPPSLRV